jgi:ADP-heptose:LPS heptosyltransferase
MYRDGKQVLTHMEHRFILSHGALGDMICSLPALIHARTHVSKDMKMVVYVAPWQVDLVTHLLKPYGDFDVRSLNDVPLGHKERMAKWGGEVPNSMNAAIMNTHTRNRTHMVDYAFQYLLDAKPENMNQRCYPVEAPLGKRVISAPYVVFPVGATTANKLFKAAVMQPVIQWVLEQGYFPVLVGTKTTHVRAELGDGTTEPLTIRDEIDKMNATVVAQCVDMREKTTLLELRDLLGHADAVVGVDGGTLHLAGTTDTKIVYAMGTTLPKHRFIARRGDPNYAIRYVGPRNLECIGCQSNWVLTRWDFRECAYGDSKCMDMLHPEDFINALKELGL